MKCRAEDERMLNKIGVILLLPHPTRVSAPCLQAPWLTYNMRTEDLQSFAFMRQICSMGIVS